MNRLYISIMSRLTQDRQPCGEKARVICYDIDTGEHFSRYFDITSVPELSRSVGCRGICYHKNVIWLATSERGLLRLDPEDLSILSNVFFNSTELQHTHQIRVHDGNIWMCDTQHDRIAITDGEKILEYKDCSCDRELLDTQANNQKASEYGCDRLHFNSIEWAPNGDQWHIYMNCNALFNFTTKEIVLPPPEKHAGMHDILFIDDDRMIYNSSNHNSTFEYNLRTKEYRLIWTEPRKVRKDNISNQVGWARGVEIDREEGILYVTYTPCILQAYDIKDNYKRLFRKELDSDIMESTYDMVLVKN